MRVVSNSIRTVVKTLKLITRNRRQHEKPIELVSTEILLNPLKKFSQHHLLQQIFLSKLTCVNIHTEPHFHNHKQHSFP